MAKQLKILAGIYIAVGLAATVILFTVDNWFWPLMLLGIVWLAVDVTYVRLYERAERD